MAQGKRKWQNSEWMWGCVPLQIPRNHKGGGLRLWKETRNAHVYQSIIKTTKRYFRIIQGFRGQFVGAGLRVISCLSRLDV